MNAYFTLIQREWRILLFGFVLTFFSGPGQTYFISFFGGEIRQDLGLSHSQFGAAYSTATFISAMLLLYSGSLLDRIALPKFALGVVAGLAGACIGLSAAQNILMLSLAILALRQFGQGLMTMTSSTTMMRYIPENKGKANSIAAMGYSAGEASLPSLLLLLLLVFSWREAWLLIAAVLVLIVPLMIHICLKDFGARHSRYLAAHAQHAAKTPEQHTQRQWTRAEVIRDPLFYLFIPALMSQAMIYTGFMFHQIHLVEAKTWDINVWASLYVLFSSVSIISSLSVAALADKFGVVRLVPFMLLPAMLGLLSLASTNQLFVAAVFMVCMALSTGAQAALSAPFFAERYGNQHFGAIKSLGSFVMVFMTAISPVLIGWLIDYGIHINRIALGFALYALLASAAAFIAYRASLRA